MGADERKEVRELLSYEYFVNVNGSYDTLGVVSSFLFTPVVLHSFINPPRMILGLYRKCPFSTRIESSLSQSKIFQFL